MEHVVIPLDPDHARVAGDLARGAATAAGVPEAAEAFRAHVTLVAHTEGRPGAVRSAVAELAVRTEPFTVHAHGFGFFAGDRPSSLNLHVPVVRTPALSAFHQALCEALAGAGADVAAWCLPELWSPHVTIVDRELDTAGLAAAAGWLAARHHPSWQLPVDRVVLTGGWSERDQPAQVLCLEGEGKP